MRIVTKLSLALTVTSLGVAIAALLIMRDGFEGAVDDAGAKTSTIVSDAGRRDQEHKVLLVVSYLADGVASPLHALDIAVLDARIKDALKAPDALQAEVLNVSGRIIADGTSEVYLKNLVRKDPTHRRVVRATSPAFRWERDTITAWAPVRIGHDHIGAVWVKFSLKSHEKVRSDLTAAQEGIVGATYAGIQRQTVVVIGLAGLLAVVLGVLLGIVFTRPVIRVTEATRRAAAGDLDARVAVKGSDEVAVLGQGFNRMLEEIKASRDAIIEKKRLEAELEIAQVVQTSILPVTMPTRELRVAARMIPAAEVGGDYYDVLIRKEATWFGIGDVSGHGLTSGLMMMMVQSATSALTELVPDVRPSVCVSTVNRVMFDNVRCRMKGNDHMTFTLLRYLGNGQFQFAGGHEPMLVWRKQSATIEVMDTPGPWIGAQQDLTSVLPDSELTLAPGDRLILFTDGITEAHTGDHRLFGIERLSEAVAKPADTVDQVVENVFRAVDAFTSRRYDDQSIVVIERDDN